MEGVSAKRCKLKFTWVLILFATLTAGASPADVSGKWKVRFSGPSNSAPKTVGSIILDLRVDGERVTGTVNIGVWPGEAPIADVRVDGDKITFTATGTRSSTTGIPTCKFVVTVRNDDMFLTMTVIANAGGPLAAGTPYEFSGKRAS